MKFKNLKFCVLLLLITAVFISCGDDDEGTTTTIELADRTEQQVIDKDVLITYLSTHYYNSSFFESNTNQKYTDIIIQEIEEGQEVPDGNTLLIDAVETRFTTYLEAEYEYYVLNINQGGGESPKFTDSVRVRYEGSSVNTEANGVEEVFDVVSSPVDFDMIGNGITTLGTIRAWQIVMPSFNAAVDLDYTIDENGNVNFNNYGLGVMFVPSGIAYFAGTSTGSSYDNLIFKFELLQYQELDHDNDGIPSYLEDLDTDLDTYDDDTDENLYPNFIDNDDDGDGVPTINEDIDGDGDPTNDIGANGIPKYLDDTETESNEENE